MQMADGDEDDLACLSAAVVIAGVVRCRQQHRRCQSCWVRPWMCSRPRLGEYAALLQDIISTDEKAYQNVCWLCPDDYNQLLTTVWHALLMNIDERSTSWRQHPHCGYMSLSPSTCRQKLNMFNFWWHVESDTILYPIRSTCRRWQATCR